MVTPALGQGRRAVDGGQGAGWVDTPARAVVFAFTLTLASAVAAILRCNRVCLRGRGESHFTVTRCFCCCCGVATYGDICVCAACWQLHPSVCTWACCVAGYTLLQASTPSANPRASVCCRASVVASQTIAGQTQSAVARHPLHLHPHADHHRRHHHQGTGPLYLGVPTI